MDLSQIRLKIIDPTPSSCASSVEARAFLLAVVVVVEDLDYMTKNCCNSMCCLKPRRVFYLPWQCDADGLLGRQASAPSSHASLTGLVPGSWGLVKRQALVRDGAVGSCLS